MKFELNLAVKAVPMADCHISLECTAEELAVALADPVYQEIGKALVAKLSQSTNQRQDNDHRKAQHRQEAQHKTQQAQNEAIMKVLSTINDRMDSLKRNGKHGKPQWGELD